MFHCSCRCLLVCPGLTWCMLCAARSQTQPTQNRTLWLWPHYGSCSYPGHLEGFSQISTYRIGHVEQSRCQRRDGDEKTTQVCVPDQRLKRVHYKQILIITDLGLETEKRNHCSSHVVFTHAYTRRTNQHLLVSVLNSEWRTLLSSLKVWSQLCGVQSNKFTRWSKWWRALIKQAHRCWNGGSDLKVWIRQVDVVDYSRRNWRVLMFQPQHS